MVDADLLNWTINQFLCLVIILVRVAPLLFFMPVIGTPAVPAQVKILFSLMVSLVLVPVVPVGAADLPSTVPGLMIFVITEICLGAFLAVFARLVFAAVQVAGQMVGIQMGMGMAGVMDPQFGAQVSLIGQLWNVVAILIFLAMDGHHIFVRTMIESFNFVRPGTMHITQATYSGMMQGAAQMFVMAVKIMAPASAAVFFTHVAMGIIAKTVPQIPILIVGMPINIAVGFIFVGLSLGYFMPLMINYFDRLGRDLPRLAAGMG